MKVIKKLTLKYLKLNKKRTIVTIIGVIISVAMITAISTFASSMLDLEKRQMNSYSDFGEWHVKYREINSSDISEIINKTELNSYVINKEPVVANIQNENISKKGVNITSVSESGLEKLSTELSSGSMPKSDNEIAISEKLCKELNYNLGDTLNLNIEGETKNYIITGFIAQKTNKNILNSFENYPSITYLNNNDLVYSNTLNLTIELKKLSNDIYSNTEEIANNLNINYDKNVEYNAQILALNGISRSGKILQSMWIIVLIIIGIVMLCSIALIYNSFAISVSERSKTLGMLSSIGATKFQKMQSIFFESLFIGLIAIPLGLVVGILGTKLFFILIPLIMNSIEFSEPMRIVLSFESILIAVVSSIVTILISALIPMIRASKVTPINAIRQVEDINIKSRQVKTSKITRKIFGFEAELGLKNLKRNKKKYRATIISLVISIFLFLNVSMIGSFFQKTSYIINSMFSARGETSDASVMYIDSKISNEKIEEIDKKIKTVPHIEKVVNSKTITSSSDVNNLNFSDNFKNLIEDRDSISISIETFDDDYLKSYLSSVNLDFNDLNDINNPKALILNHFIFRKDDNYTESVKLDNNMKNSVKLDNFDKDMELVGFLNNDFPISMSFNSSSMSGNLQLIVTKDVFDSIDSSIVSKKALITFDKESKNNKENLNQINDDLFEIQSGLNNQIMIFNFVQVNLQMQQINLIFNICIYGFIILITLICIINLFNTITTNISLRRREFAMLKSVGMTQKSFRKMICYESVFYGLKALLYGIPISFITIILIYLVINFAFKFAFFINWIAIIIVILGVFLIVTTTMLYSISKIKKENIIDGLKQENI